MKQVNKAEFYFCIPTKAKFTKTENKISYYLDSVLIAIYEHGKYFINETTQKQRLYRFRARPKPKLESVDIDLETLETYIVENIPYYTVLRKGCSKSINTKEYYNTKGDKIAIAALKCENVIGIKINKKYLVF